MFSHLKQDQRYWSIYNQKTLSIYQSKLSKHLPDKWQFCGFKFPLKGVFFGIKKAISCYQKMGQKLFMG
jgi:hypothetical protein